MAREFLKSQIEVGTSVHRSPRAAGAELAELRQAVASLAAEHGLAPIAASTHPFARWSTQEPTERERYQAIAQDLAGVGRRLVICGMHVHVGIEDDELRIDLFNQARYFLPHLLMLSTSSPFAEGEDTGLKCYRLAAYQELPRTGMPGRFEGWEEYTPDRRPAGAQRRHRGRQQDLVGPAALRRASRRWRCASPTCAPGSRMRVCVAAMYVCILRMLFRLRRSNQTWRTYPLFLLAENRWRAQRYGVEGTLFDLGKGELVAFGDLVEELLVHAARGRRGAGLRGRDRARPRHRRPRHQRRPAGRLLPELLSPPAPRAKSAQGRRRSPDCRNRRHRSRQVSRTPMHANIRPAKPILAVLAAVAVAGTMAAHAADRAQATVACKPAGVWLAYDCTVKLANATTGAPLQKAQLTIGADMPSRPLADKVAPVAAKATATPGEYRAIVVLEVHGDWALRLNVAAGPIKHQLTELLNFGPKEVGPAKNPNPAPPAPAPKGRPKS